jgi:hypothetical protein
MYPDQYAGDTRAKRITKRHAKHNNVIDNTLLWNYSTRSFHDFISNIGTITSYSYAIKICKEVRRMHIDFFATLAEQLIKSIMVIRNSNCFTQLYIELKLSKHWLNLN